MISPWCWLMIRCASDAERVFKAVLARDPASAAAEIGVAIAAMARRDFIAAEEALQRAVTQDPGRAAIYQTMREVYAQTGRKAQAVHMEKIARRLGAGAEDGAGRSKARN